MRNDYYADPLLKEISSCQRNFDQSKAIESEKMAILDEWAGKPPQQTGTRHCTVIKITNTNCMLELSKLLRGKAVFQKDKVYQPQINAYVCYVWTATTNKETAEFSAGFESGLLSAKATMLGLKTGFAKCGPPQGDETDPNWNAWKLKWKIDHKKHNSFGFALGIGYPIEDKPYYWSTGYKKYNEDNHTHIKPNWADITVID